MKILKLLVAVLFASVAEAQQVPNYRADVEACVVKYSTAWSCAHTGRSCSTDFVILCARDISAKDNRVGINGKRGNPNDLSQDILAFRGIGSAVDVTRGNSPMEIVDICGGCGGSNPVVTWSVAPGGAGDRGAWVDPFSVQPSTGGGTGGGGTDYGAQLARIEAALAILSAQVTALGPLTYQAASESATAAARAEDLQHRSQDIANRLEALAARPVTVDWPEYRGRVLGQTITLRPQ